MQTAKFPDRIVLMGSDEFEDNKLKSMMQMLDTETRFVLNSTSGK